MHTHVEITSDQMLIDGFIHSIQLIFTECLILGTETIRKNKILSFSKSKPVAAVEAVNYL